MSIAIIGGSGLNQFSADRCESVQQETPFGAHSSGVKRIPMGDHSFVFLPRHGGEHEQPPHKVNYRANIWLLKSLGVTDIIAFNVVGGIHASMPPRAWIVPHQIIDYSWGREHTFFDGLHEHTEYVKNKVDHIDFTYPYSSSLRQQLLAFFQQVDRHTESPSIINPIDFGTYACTQGPRLETAAEILRLKNDGCDIVGMTAMPEAALARELSINYAALCLVANWGAGLVEDELSISDIMSLVADEVKKMAVIIPELVDHCLVDHCKVNQVSASAEQAES